MKKLLWFRVLWFLVFAFAWVACASARTEGRSMPDGGGKAAPVVRERPRLLGDPGETALHFYARLITRTCTASEIPADVDRVARRLAECEDLDGACEERICSELRTEPLTAGAQR